MKSYITPVSVTVLLVGTLVAGWLHGSVTTGWGNQAMARSATEQLSRPLPEQVGNWKLRGKDVPLEPGVQEMLKCSASVNRVYVHTQTGDLISVAVLLGPSGPIAVHTPEICYSGVDFDVSSERQKTNIKDAEGKEHAFWEVTVKAKGPDAYSQRVLYGWSTGTVWEATGKPRFAFGGAPYLYKLQLAAPPAKRTDLEDFDPCEDFLSQFLVQCGSRMVEARSAPPPSPPSS